MTITSTTSKRDLCVAIYIGLRRFLTSSICETALTDLHGEPSILGPDKHDLQARRDTTAEPFVPELPRKTFTKHHVRVVQTYIDNREAVVEPRVWTHVSQLKIALICRDR